MKIARGKDLSDLETDNLLRLNVTKTETGCLWTGTVPKVTTAFILRMGLEIVVEIVHLTTVMLVHWCDLYGKWEVLFFR